jgi:hypothetical protein
VATIPAIIIPNPANVVKIKQQLTESSIKKLKKKMQKLFKKIPAYNM